MCFTWIYVHDLNQLSLNGTAATGAGLHVSHYENMWSAVDTLCCLKAVIVVKLGTCYGRRWTWSLISGILV